MLVVKKATTYFIFKTVSDIGWRDNRGITMGRFPEIEEFI